MGLRKYLAPGILLLVSGACSPVTLPDEISLSSSTPSQTPQIVQVTASFTVSPTASPTLTSAQPVIPVTGSNAILFHDQISEDTASEKGASEGEEFGLNRFERPFSRYMETYQPDLDIDSFAILEENDWYIALIKMVGQVNTAQSQVYYGVELDIDHDGIGDYLIWAQAPDATTWSAENVQVLEDQNHDSAGNSPLQSDSPFFGDGYETVIFDGGTSTDSSDLAWIRLDPDSKETIQLAFKKSLVDPSFMWSAWADGGLKDPGLFSYNDRLTQEQAGSPLRENSYYPIDNLYSIDNTCRAAYGFDPTGQEPLLCASILPTPTSQIAEPQEKEDNESDEPNKPVNSPVPTNPPPATDIPTAETAALPTQKPASPIPPSPTDPPAAITATQPSFSTPVPKPTTIQRVSPTPPRSRDTPLPPKRPTATDPPGPTGIPSTPEGTNMPTN